MLDALKRLLPGNRREVREQARKAVDVGAALASPVVPTVLLVAGAGVAFWYWRQWSRGRAEVAGGLAPTDHVHPVITSPAAEALDEGMSVQGSAESPRARHR